MDHLNKQQIILLALLVSFVTAIATGITTVSLMDKSPEGVQQTIYKVVERTIEKVTTENSPVRKIVEPAKEKPKTPEISVTDIVNKAGKSLVRIYRKNAAGEKSEYVGIGIAIGTKDSIFSSGNKYELQYIIISSDGKEYNAIPGKFIGGISTIKIVYSDKDIKIPALVLSSENKFEIGSNVVVVGGKESNNVVSTGIIKEIGNKDGEIDNVFTTDISLTTPDAGLTLFGTKGEFGALYIGNSGGVEYQSIETVLKNFPDFI